MPLRVVFSLFFVTPDGQEFHTPSFDLNRPKVERPATVSPIGPNPDASCKATKGFIRCVNPDGSVWVRIDDSGMGPPIVKPREPRTLRPMLDRPTRNRLINKR